MTVAERAAELIESAVRRVSSPVISGIAAFEATGWLPHTTRAALTGLRKKGHGIEKRRRGGATCYHVAAVA